ncbi:hypothetical protein Hanom_Chr13g01200031 [Helianthus anomalus]
MGGSAIPSALYPQSSIAVQAAVSHPTACSEELQARGDCVVHVQASMSAPVQMDEQQYGQLPPDFP